MQHTITIRDELVLEAHAEGDSPHPLAALHLLGRCKYTIFVVAP
jgi:hypothetical protein